MDHKHNKRKIIIVSVLACIILIPITYIVIRTVNSNNSAKPKTITQSQAEAQKISDQSGAIPSTDSAKEAQTELTKLANDTNSKEAKQIYLSQAAEILMNSKDYRTALDIAKQAEQANSTASTAAQTAYIYSQLADYKNAAINYQLAADRSEKSDNVDARTPYNDYIILKNNAEALIK